MFKSPPHFPRDMTGYMLAGKANCRSQTVFRSEFMYCPNKTRFTPPSNNVSMRYLPRTWHGCKGGPNQARSTWHGMAWLTC